MSTLTRPRHITEGTATSGRAATWTPPVVAALVAMLAGGWSFWSKPLWRDEVITWATAGRPLGALARHLAVDDAGLAGYYLLMHVWLVAGDATWWLRLPSVVGVVVAAVFTALAAGRVAGPVAALAAGVLLPLFPVVAEHAAEARPYPLVLASVAVAGWLLLRYRDEPTRAAAAGFVVACAAAVVFHPMAGAPAVAGLVAAGWIRLGLGSRRWIAAALAFPVAAALLVLWVGPQQARRTGGIPLSAVTRLRWGFAPTTVGVAALALLVAVGLVWLWRTHRDNALVFAVAAAVPLAGIGALGVLGSFFQTRYAIGAAPAVAVLAGAGAAALWSASRAWPARTVALLVVAAVVALIAPAAVSQRTALFYVDDPATAAAAVNAAARPGDTVIYLGSTARAGFTYYPIPDVRDALLVQAPPAGTGLGGVELTPPAMPAALAASGRVWLIGTLDGDQWSPGPHPDQVAAAAAAGTTGRRLMSSADYGRDRVQLWASSVS